MIPDPPTESTRPPRRLRFSLLALLFFVTLICITLAWWRYIYIERKVLLAKRDLIAQSVVNLQQEIARKWQEYLDIARESGRAEGGTGNVMIQLLVADRDRIATELMRLEREVLERQLAGSTDASSLIEKRIAKLREQQQALTDELKSRTERSVELETRASELRQLQRLADDLSLKLEELDIEIQARGLTVNSGTSGN